jgi:hypothetical protein
MSYDNPIAISFAFPTHDFGAGAGAVSFKGPPGKTGRLIDIAVHVTETFNQVTTPGYVRVGTGANPDAYAELNMGAAANTDTWNTQDDPDAIIDSGLPADTQIEVAFVAPTGGTPAGIGNVTIATEWY